MTDQQVLGNILSRADHLIEIRRYKEAATELLAALKLEPENTITLQRLGFCYYKLGNIEPALFHLRQAIAVAPTNAHAFYLIGCALVKNKEPQEAFKSFYKALELDPTQASYHAGVANAFQHTEQWVRALEHANKGLAVDPHHQSCLNIRARALMLLNRFDESRETALQSLRAKPNESDAHITLGWIHLRNNQVDDAMYSFRQGLSSDPTDDFARSGLLDALRRKYSFFNGLLRYKAWLGNFDLTQRKALIIGLLIFSLLFAGFADNLLGNGKLVTVAHILIMAAFMSPWIVEPISNLILRFNSFGRHVLSRFQLHVSIATGVALLQIVFGGIMSMVDDHFLWWSFVIFGFGNLAMAGTIFLHEGSLPSERRLWFTSIAIGLQVFAIVIAPGSEGMSRFASGLFTILILILMWANIEV